MKRTLPDCCRPTAAGRSARLDRPGAFELLGRWTEVQLQQVDVVRAQSSQALFDACNDVCSRVVVLQHDPEDRALGRIVSGRVERAARLRR